MDRTTTESDTVLISALNQYVFCPRRCALMHIEGIWSDNQHTVTGTLLHDHADAPGYESDGDVTVLRAVPLYSTRHGLAGKADIIELRNGEPTPVEYKKGRRRRFDNDDIQLCAQAFCLEEMFACEVPAGYIYHAASHRRREVLFDWRLREATLEAISAVRRLLAEGRVPPAVLAPRCDGCSLRHICLPELTGAAGADPSQVYHQLLWSE
jgi:CRISPR-associated exonuclease Cas4